MRVCKYTYFQSSAGRSQAHDRKWCKSFSQFSQTPLWSRFSRNFSAESNVREPLQVDYVVVKITHFPRWTRDSPRWTGMVLRLANLYFLIHEFLVAFVGPCQLKRIRNRGFALLDGSDHVGAADPVGFFVICLWTTGRGGRGESGRSRRCLLRGRGLRAESSPVRGDRYCSGCGRNRCGCCRSGRSQSRCGSHRRRTAKEHAAAFVWVGFFAVVAQGVVVFSGEF